MSDARFYNTLLKEQDALIYHSVMTSPLEWFFLKFIFLKTNI
jgi:hypothetical protein